MEVIFRPREKHATELAGSDFLHSNVSQAPLYPTAAVSPETFHDHVQTVLIGIAITSCIPNYLPGPKQIPPFVPVSLTSYSLPVFPPISLSAFISSFTFPFFLGPVALLGGSVHLITITT